MGVAFHELMLLKKVAQARPLGDVLTLGRQNLNLPRSSETYADRLLLDLGATLVESVDYSAFEGATHVADLNRPLELGKQFDTVIDFGTTEHVFSVSVALENCVRLCRIGGAILHAVPANGECGHGFWQMSPELFLSLYSERNGFAETEVFIADLMDERFWWRAKQPQPGDRLFANSVTSTYVLVSTIKAEDRPLAVRQSDYEHSWATGRPQAQLERDTRRERMREALKRSPLRHVGSFAYRTMLARTGLTRFNPNLEKVSIRDAIASAPQRTNPLRTDR